VIGIFDRYILKLLAGTTLVIAFALTMIILLTQSLRYLELVIGSDASAIYFLMMTGLAIPKFLEVILPVAFVISCAYLANKLMNDREIVVMNASGISVLRYARGFLIFTVVMMGIQFALSGWIAPTAVNELQKTRADVKSHYATLMFREGVFNDLGNGMTAFVEERRGMNELHNLMIHDPNGYITQGQKTTIIAERGIVNITNDQQQILVYSGTQYQKGDDHNRVSRLDFDQYILDVPIQNNPVSVRWREPDERTFDELFLGDNAPSRDLSKQDEFIAEAHKRITTPFLYVLFVGLVLTLFFMGQWGRERNSRPVLILAGAVCLIEVIYIVVYNQARDQQWLNIGLYAVTLLPLIYIFYRFKRYYRR
jgi:lipopolysaccharide export system permease protein